ncbi:polyprenyl synthetase family protein [Campylobacter sp. faydin G-105]|uniref:polyprenyl synthetase family protein n=1 Tax=Campylobacter anatolicus TaxID=2829105 RepID=UPI001BA19E6E|nr:polyprenyl synthetase family protein [Campylobacter anatolicus]MBR8461343.1 polyprenyl synthetase family protein [Campylobacter anatolicus]
MRENLLTDFIKFREANLPKAPSFHPYFEEALGYTLSSGGKHFRAMLLLGVVNALRPELTTDAFDIALGFEMMHSYSLIHDDLPAMDDSNLRRGVPSLHIKYDEVTAILVGDALNTHAFYQLSRANLDAHIRLKCIEILSQNAGASGMVLGQAIDCFFENNPKNAKIKQALGLNNKRLNLDELTFLHMHKTAKLIAASLQAGAVIASMSESKCEKIYNIGLELGLAFQIQDDIIDATVTSQEAGKPTLNDSEKNSFTNLLGVAEAVRCKNEMIKNIIKELSEFEPSIKTMIINLIDKHLK